MSTTPGTGQPNANAPESASPNAVSLWFRFPPAAAGCALLIGCCHLFYSLQPLHHTDLWGHLAYGRIISAAHAIPATEPLMPLAAGVKFIDTAWLTQLLGYEVFSLWGLAGVQFLHAAAISTMLALLAGVCLQHTRSLVFTVIGLTVFEALNWYQLQIVRPQLAGLVCYCVLGTMLASRNWRTSYWVAIPAMIALWANLHGSFPIGLAVLICAGAGRAIDVWRSTGSLVAGLRDGHARRLVLITGLAAAAALLNPYGPRLYAEVVTMMANPNLHDLIEWNALDFRTRQGELAIAAALILAVVYSLNRRRIPAGEVLALVGLGAAACWSARLLVWWTPLAAGVITIRLQGAWLRFQPTTDRQEPTRCHGKWTWITIGLAGGSVIASVIVNLARPGHSLDVRTQVSRQTPVGAADWLREHPPVGQIFNTYEWGDYLLWAGPPGLRVFVASHAHLVPRAVWRDYMQIINGKSDWQVVFDHYAIETVVLDQPERADLISKITANSGWKTSYADGLAVIFTRRDRGLKNKPQSWKSQ
jgi:hypothetical protein